MQRKQNTGGMMRSSRLLLSLIVPGVLLAAGPANNSPGLFRKGSILVGFNQGISAAQQSSIVTGSSGKEIKHLLSGDVHILNVPPGHELEIIQLLKKLPGVRYAEPDYIQYADGGPVPNDTSVGVQWAVQNTGQNADGTSGTPGADERTLSAWGVTTGTNSVVVAVLDSGTQYSHPDLASNMWSNPGGIGGCAAGTHGYNVLASSCDPMDDDAGYGGHGTHVSGILGAIGNNQQGVAGVNWTTSIMAVKWVDSNDSGATSDLLTAMDWVVQAKQAGVNVRVVNDSATWPGTAFSQAVSDEIDALGANDILFVCAAGNTAENNDTTPRYPCSYNRPTMICTAASDQNDNLWSSSNFGVNTVQLAAPGVNIFSTLRLSNYGYISGGSMASPQVAGTAALILSLGYQSVSNLRSMILNNVDTLPSLSGLVATGGRLNVCKAVPGCSSASTSVPSNTSPPVVAGQTTLGSVLGASTGAWSGIPTRFSYQWSRCNSTGGACSAISGATSQTYSPLGSGDAGATLRVSITASNSAGSNVAQSGPSAAIAAQSSPFALNSSISDGATISGSIQWSALPSQGVNFVEFYIDGARIETVSSSPYTYNQSSTGVLDTTTLSNGTHVLGMRALANDNETYGFSGATVTVSNGGSGGGGGGIAMVQSAAVEGSGVPSVAAAFPSANTRGNLIVAFVRMSSTSQTVSISDSAGNLYTDAVSQAQTSDGHQIHLFYAANVAGGANTVTASFSATNNHPWLAIYEFSGVSALDRTAAAQGASAFASSGATANTSSANELLFAGVGLPASYTGTASAGSGFTAQQQDTGTSRGASETGLATATGSFTGAFNLSASTNWSAVIATFTSSAPPPNPPTITTTSLPSGTQGASYSATLTATGGTTPYTWSITSGSLPAGLALNSGSGVISGTPSSSGTSSFTVQVTDSHSQTASKALSITISSNPPTITTTSLPSGTQGTSYSATLTATGGTTPYTWSITSGSLPAGLALNSGSGLISGTPSSSGTSSFTVQVTDSHSQTASKALSITISSNPPTITTTSLPSGTQGTSYSATLTATGGTTPYTWSITPGSLPAGLALNSGSGLISGTPSSSGTSSFTVQVTGSNSQTASKALSITINPSGGGGGGGIAMVQSAAVEGSGVPSVAAAFPSANTKGNLIVAFVRMSSTSQTVSVSDSAGNLYTDAVSQAQTSDGHQIHVFYAANVAGGANTVTASFSATNNHPWLAIYEFSGVSALDRTAAAQGASAFASSGATANTSSANELLFAGVGLPASYTGTASAGSGFTAQQQDTGTSRGASETGLATATGSFTGAFNLSASTNWSAVIATFTSSAPPPNPPTITTTSLPSGTQGTSYSATLTATGGTTPYTWSITTGSLPAGLALNSGSGAISGTPSSSGTSSFTVQVTDSNSQTASKALSITISSTGGGGGGIAMVQSAAVEGSGVPSVAVAFPSANTRGNLIIAFVRMSTTSQTVSVADSSGNVYTDAVSQAQTSDGHQIHIFYAANVTGGTNTITASFSGTNNHPWLAIYEFSGVTALDQTAATQGASAFASSGPTASTSSANELLFAGVGLPASYTGTASAGSGFAVQQQDTGTSRGANETGSVTATGSFAATFNLSASTNWTAAVATFHP